METTRHRPWVVFLLALLLTAACEQPANHAGAASATGAACLGTGTTYPLLHPRSAYAAARHLGEGRFGSVGIIGKHPQISDALVSPECTPAGCRLAFGYEFRATDAEEFADLFVSLSS